MITRLHFGLICVFWLLFNLDCEPPNPTKTESTSDDVRIDKLNQRLKGVLSGPYPSGPHNDRAKMIMQRVLADLETRGSIVLRERPVLLDATYMDSDGDELDVILVDYYSLDFIPSHLQIIHGGTGGDVLTEVSLEPLSEIMKVVAKDSAYMRVAVNVSPPIRNNARPLPDAPQGYPLLRFDLKPYLSENLGVRLVDQDGKVSTHMELWTIIDE